MRPDKWLTRWRERNPDVPITARRVGDPRAELASTPGSGGVDVVFLREADHAPRSAPAGLLRIPLYTETMAVLAARGHEIGVYESLSRADLEGSRGSTPSTRSPRHPTRSLPRWTWSRPESDYWCYRSRTPAR
ncbi:hypothetical protein [Dietzia sp. JS16-p6b]|uniref:hypothetical protein n=1 Tax=Dietzia sp. JS16-p6b TaxID=2052657 RepID=UPI001F27A8EF|nr:hypothetical protein [Dietzia sp. JS16-p6b]